ncbi:MAG: methylenetetrahydrofolate reductase C-terminal domain-containing protein [Candidatus Anammoxibacter sp.]
MIVAEIKPFKEIKQAVTDCKKICILGCEACVTICHAGGKKQVAEVASQLRLAAKLDGNAIEVKEDSVQRQCEWEFIEPLKEYIEDYDIALSFGCGIGTQFLAERYPKVKIFPGLNTTFMGAPIEPGVFVERCAGCGNCVLGSTGGICPVSRCAKNLLNGPCGGSKNGDCEVGNETPCVWQQIYDQLEGQNRLSLIESISPPKDWSTSISNQPRKMVLNHLKKINNE